MRLLRLLDSEFALEFHPYVTVVSGLDERARDRVVEAIGSLPRGEVGDLGGLVESHGVVLDLDQENLALLEMHNAEVDCVVRAGGLATGNGDAGPPEAAPLEAEANALNEKVAAAEAEVLTCRESVGQAQIAVEKAANALDAIDATPSAPVEAPPTDEKSRDARVTEIAAAAALLADTATALEAARVRLNEAEAVATDARHARDLVAAEASALAGQLESAEAGLDPQAGSDLEVAERRLAELRESIEQERKAEQQGSPDADQQESVEHRLARLEVQRIALDAKLAVLGGAETLAVDTALQEMRAGDDGEPALVLSADALELADQIEKAQAKLASHSGVLGSNEGTVIAARARLDAARQGLADAEHRVRLPQLDRDDIDELEVAHADVLDAQEKTEGRFSKSRSERRLEEARAAEDAVLDRLGFDSYAEFMMGTSMLHVDDEQEAALDLARSELADAEDAWAALQDGVDSTLEMAIVTDNLSALHDRAGVLVGEAGGDDVIERLRSHRVRASRVGDAHGRLATALQAVGLAVAHEDIEQDDLVMLADEWLAEERSANESREAALADRADVDLELAEARSQLSQAAAGMSGPSTEDRRRARTDDAASARDAASERVRRHVATGEEVRDFRAALGAMTERVDALDLEATGATSAADKIAAEVADLEAAHQSIATAHDEVVAGLAVLDESAEDVDVTDDAVDEVRVRAVEEREAADNLLSTAREELALAESRSTTLRDENAKITESIAAFRSTPEPPKGDALPASAEEVEWSLLSRLAAQRRISFAGSVPMLIDRALDELTPEEIHVVFDRLERMAAAVQLIVISETEAARQWAERAGEQRGAVVTPMKPADVVPFV